MTSWQRWSLFLLRVGLGWLFFYSGVTKIMSGHFSAAGYLHNAANFQSFYHLLSQGQLLTLTNYANEWGQLLLGISLILGIGVRISSVLGVILMLLYYFPLKFPHPDANSYIVDEHIVIALALMVLGSLNAGRVMGLDAWRRRM